MLGPSQVLSLSAKYSTTLNTLPLVHDLESCSAPAIMTAFQPVRRGRRQGNRCAPLFYELAWKLKTSYSHLIDSLIRSVTLVTPHYKEGKEIQSVMEHLGVQLELRAAILKERRHDRYWETTSSVCQRA